MASSSNVTRKGIESAGDIDLQAVDIITPYGQTYSLLGGYIGELNLFEDMYRSGLYGNILVIDANNMSQNLNLTGDELISIKMVTPTMDDSVIYKVFKCYAITDRQAFTDTGKQSYIIHFASPEIFIDSLTPLYKTFSGKPDDIVKNIFETYLATSRVGDDNYTPLVVIGDASNQIKFTSPGWRPSKCINWVSTKTIGAGYNAPNYVFYESNKAFYFGNVEQIIDIAKNSKMYYQDYYFVAQNLDSPSAANQVSYVKDIDFEFKKVEDMHVIETYNSLKSTQNGYLANRLFTFDVISKTHDVYDYDHVLNYSAYHHMEDMQGQSLAPFNTNSLDSGGALRSPGQFNQLYMKHKTLYTDFTNNVSDVIDKILPPRTSTMAELTNFKIEITVPGRTDIEVGALVNFHYPDISPRDTTDLNKAQDDQLYSGIYLVTAVRHKIVLTKHMMILELVKDSYKVPNNE